MDPRGANRASHSAQRFARTVLLLAALSPWAAGAVVIYDSVPAPLPPNVPGVAFEASSTSEFGGLIEFAGTSRALTQVSLVMSDWALAADHPAFPGTGGPTWSHPLTFNLYQVDNSGPNPAPGAVIATRTQAFAIPWRPVADPTCATPTQWRASNGICYSGVAFMVTFDFTGTTVPDRIIYGLAFNTRNHGYAPIGAPGPYVSLNQGVAQVPPSTGSNPFPDTAYWNTSNAAGYADGGVGGVGIFRRDTAWTPFSGAVRFNALDALAGANPVPALSPLALLLLATGVALFGLMKTR